MYADAVPATDLWCSSARAWAFGRIMPNAATNPNSGRNSTGSEGSAGRPMVASAQSAAPLVTIRARAIRVIRPAPTRGVSRVPICAAAVSPRALIVNSRLNTCGLLW